MNRIIWNSGRRRKQLRPRRAPGFTIVELILVVTIMTVVSIFAAMALSNLQDAAKIEQTKATIGMIELALDQHKVDIGSYPRCTGAQLEPYLTNPNQGWRQASMSTWFPNRQDIKDAWAQVIEYCSWEEYESSGRGVERTVVNKVRRGDFYNPDRYQLYSMGPNMKTFAVSTGAAKARLCGTEPDDIRNWQHDRFYRLSDYE